MMTDDTVSLPVVPDNGSLLNGSDMCSPCGADHRCIFSGILSMQVLDKNSAT